MSYEFDTTVIKGYMSMKEIKEQRGFSPDDMRVWVGKQMAQ